MYEAFAEVYDAFMEEISYGQWADYIEQLFEKHQGSLGRKPHLVLDLGCGTGGLSMELFRRGYDMIGADASAEMLSRAREKAMEEGALDKVLFLQQDMRCFELYGTVDAIVITCDSLNYMLTKEDLGKVFALAENYLEQGGLLIFDINTLYKYENVLGDATFADLKEDAGFIWENSYDPATRINEYAVTFFIEEEEGVYRRYEELHRQRGYELSEIKNLLESAHLKVEGQYEAFTMETPQEESQRVFFVAREYREKRRYDG